MKLPSLDEIKGFFSLISLYLKKIFLEEINEKQIKKEKEKLIEKSYSSKNISKIESF